MASFIIKLVPLSDDSKDAFFWPLFFFFLRAENSLRERVGEYGVGVVLMGGGVVEGGKRCVGWRVCLGDEHRWEMRGC